MKEDNADQVALLLQANQLSKNKKEDARKIQLQIAKNRLANLEAKKKKKAEIQAIKDKYFDSQTVQNAIKEQQEKASLFAQNSTRPNSAVSARSRTDSITDSITGSIISKSDWLDAEHERERNFIMNVKEISDELAAQLASKSDSYLSDRLEALQKLRADLAEKILESAIERNVQKSVQRTSDEDILSEVDSGSEPDLKILADQQIEMNKIFQEAMVIRNELTKRRGSSSLSSPDGGTPWENLLVDVNLAQDIESTVHEDFEKNQILDKVLIESMNFEPLNQVLSNKTADSNIFEANLKKLIETTSRRVAEKLLAAESKDANKVAAVQQILAERRVQNAKDDENFTKGGDDENAFGHAPDDQNTKANLQTSASAEISSGSAKPQKQIKRKGSINIGASQTAEEAMRKLEELKQNESRRIATMNRQKTNLAEQLARRKTQIQLRKGEIGDTAAGLVQEHKAVQDKQQEQLTRQKTLVLQRTKTLVRERTMIRREKTLVRENKDEPGATDKSQDFAALDAEKAAQKAADLQQRFTETLKQESDTGKISDVEPKTDDAYLNANKEPEFDTTKLASRSDSTKRKVKSEAAKKKALRRRVKSRARGTDSEASSDDNDSNDGDQDQDVVKKASEKWNEAQSAQQVTEEPKRERRKKTFVNPDLDAKPTKSALKKSEPVASGRTDGITVEDEVVEKPRRRRKKK